MEEILLKENMATPFFKFCVLLLGQFSQSSSNSNRSRFRPTAASGRGINESGIVFCGKGVPSNPRPHTSRDFRLKTQTGR